jgi:hypothetical protein
MKKNIEKEIFEDDIFLRLTSFSLSKGQIVLTFSLFLENNDYPVQKWQVTCVGVKEYRLESYDFEEFEVLDDHYYLWDYNKNVTELFFKGEPQNIKEIIADLYLKHTQVTQGVVPFEKYINVYENGNGDLLWLLKGKQGLFSEGPHELVKTYERILLDNGLETSSLPIQIKKCCEDCRVLLFGESFVVAKAFNANSIK